MTWPTQQGTFALGDFSLQSGVRIPSAPLSWSAHGRCPPPVRGTGSAQVPRPNRIRSSATGVHRTSAPTRYTMATSEPSFEQSRCPRAADARATDLYFRTADSESDLPFLASASLRRILSIWGLRAGNPVANLADMLFISNGVRGWLECWKAERSAKQAMRVYHHFNSNLREQ
jgi:hypothetical protein